MAANNYYQVLGITPWANDQQIRSAYRDLSKLYHPDTTELDPDLSLEKFRELNQAYAILSNPERRQFYNQSIQFSRDYTFKPTDTFTNSTNYYQPLSADSGLPSERPLSAGELFAIFIFGLSLILCIGAAIAVAILRGDQLMFNIP
jgi:curved DNA-binding protein CbpA